MKLAVLLLIACMAAVAAPEHSGDGVLKVLNDSPVPCKYYLRRSRAEKWSIFSIPPQHVASFYIPSDDTVDMVCQWRNQAGEGRYKRLEKMDLHTLADTPDGFPVVVGFPFLTVGKTQPGDKEWKHPGPKPNDCTWAGVAYNHNVWLRVPQGCEPVTAGTDSPLLPDMPFPTPRRPPTR
jgi:hypothetical protein